MKTHAGARDDIVKRHANARDDIVKMHGNAQNTYFGAQLQKLRKNEAGAAPAQVFGPTCALAGTTHQTVFRRPVGCPRGGESKVVISREECAGGRSKMQ